MAHVLVIGAGVAGCTVAYTLAERGVDVTLVEKSPFIGGKVRLYGCKSVENKCQNCGVCLTTNLWKSVENHESIIIKHGGTSWEGEKRDATVICTGFDNLQNCFSSHLHFDCFGNSPGLITGTQLEELLLQRTRKELFENLPGITDIPKSVAFIQCAGSRDVNEGGMYCSKVCCSYSTRSAKVIRSYYPDCEIVFFYMELQNVEPGNFYAGLCDLGIKFIKCRPLKITGSSPLTVEYDDALTGINRKDFDLVVLSNGIRASVENDKLAELYELGIDKDGFLQSACVDTGIYVCGCARAPMKIDEAYSDAVAVACGIIAKYKT